LQLAECDASPFATPLVMVVRGLSGSGKSTLANRLADLLDCQLLQTDEIRNELLGPGDGPCEFNQGRYRSQQRRAVYQEMFRRAAALLDQGESVILDGTFLARDLRQQAVALAATYGAEPFVVRCQCPQPLAMQRIAARLNGGRSDSEAGPELYLHQREAEEGDEPEERGKADGADKRSHRLLTVDTNQDPTAVQATVAAAVRAALV
jgi:predicted kinase